MGGVRRWGGFGGGVRRLQLTVSLLFFSPRAAEAWGCKDSGAPLAWCQTGHSGAGPWPEEEPARWRHRQTQAMQEVTSGAISEGWRDLEEQPLNFLFTEPSGSGARPAPSISLHAYLTGIKFVFKSDNLLFFLFFKQ